jgi:hypothetical protein
MRRIAGNGKWCLKSIMGRRWVEDGGDEAEGIFVVVDRP